MKYNTCDVFLSFSSSSLLRNIVYSKFFVFSNLESDSSSNEDDELLFKNPNRKEFLLVEDDDSSSSEEEFSEEEGEGDDDSIKYEKTGVENELEDRNEDSGRENTNSLDSLAQKVKTVRFDE